MILEAGYVAVSTAPILRVARAFRTSLPVCYVGDLR